MADGTLFVLAKGVPFSAGLTIPGALIFFYEAGTTTKQNTYTTAALAIPHNNPVEADANGKLPAIFLDPELGDYKYVIAPATDSDPPLSPIDTVDNYPSSLASVPSFHEQTQAEIDVAATIVNGAEEVGCPNRYATNSVPGTTNMTAAIQKAFDVIYEQGGGGIKPKAEKYLYTADIRPQISADSSSRTFRLVGEGMEGSQFITNNASSFLIYGDDPPGGDNVMVSVDLDGFQITNTLAGFTRQGIDLYHCQRLNVGQVRIVGFNYGIRARSVWNFTIGKRAQLDGNNVGFKVPRQAADNVGFNTAKISGLSCANNNKAGFSIGCGNAITIDDILLESNPVGGYFVEGCAHVRFSTAYYEGSGPAPTEPDRAGTDVTHLLVVGRDEDGNIGDTALPNVDFQFGCLMDHAGEGIIYLENVHGVTFLNHEYGRNYVTFGPNVTNVRAHTFAGLNVISSPLVQGRSKSTARNVLHDFSQNLIPNGAFMFQNVPYHTFVVTPSGVASSAIVATQSIDSKLARMLDITLPGGGTVIEVLFPVHVAPGAEYATGASSLVASMQAIASSADITSVAINFVDEAATPLTGGAVKSAALTSLFVLSATANPNENVADNNLFYIKLRITRSTGTGDEHLYIDEIKAYPDNHAQTLTLGALDALVGLSGTVLATTATGAWFQGEVDTGLGNENFFRVIASPRGSGEVALQWRVDYLTGGNAGKFQIRASVDDTVFDYFIVPAVMKMP